MIKQNTRCCEKQLRSILNCQSFCFLVTRRLPHFETGFRKYVHNVETFISNCLFEISRPAFCTAAVKSMMDDVKEIGARLDTKLDSLAEEFENLTLTLKKKSFESEKPTVYCIYCQQPGHYSNQCRDNHMQTAGCGYCHKIGHTTDMCFQKQVSVPKAWINIKTTKNNEGSSRDHA